jgi:type II restriction enzyme
MAKAVSPKITEAQEILQRLGLPKEQQNVRSALTLLALARVAPTTLWSDATATSQTVRKGIMDYARDAHGCEYAENSRESFRRFTLHQFADAGVVEINPDATNTATNSSTYHYRLTPEALAVIQSYGSKEFDKRVAEFLAAKGSLAERYAAAREQAQVPVILPDGKTLALSPGKHNEIEKAVIEQFGPRFVPGAKVLYVGDTAEKGKLIDEAGFAEVGFVFDVHAKLPDVVLYDAERNWLVLVEAVASHGPVSPKRKGELEVLFSAVSAGLVFVSAFPDRAEYRKHQAEIAWETEVWLTDEPGHMVHYNGDRYLGPH